MPTGTVKWFNAEKAYGFIVDEKDNDVFVHLRDVEGGQPLNPGDKVQFEVVEEMRGPKAVRVKVLSSVPRRDRSGLGVIPRPGRSEPGRRQ